MKKQLKLSVVAATGGLLIAVDPAPAATSASPQSRPALANGGIHRDVVQLPVAAPKIGTVSKTQAPAAGNSGVLDRRHQFALGMIETGNDDREIGGAGEISRYQIMPSVWQHYSASRNYRNPQAALAVARRHWTALHDAFKQRAGREPTDFDMYVLWNTHFGYYSGRNFNPARLSPVVRDRAQRYVNLVQYGDS